MQEKSVLEFRRINELDGELNKATDRILTLEEALNTEKEEKERLIAQISELKEDLLESEKEKKLFQEQDEQKQH